MAGKPHRTDDDLRDAGFALSSTGINVLGRRHPAGRKHPAQDALAPDAMRRAVWRIVGGRLAFAVPATLLAAAGRLTTTRCVGLLTLSFAVMFASPRVTSGEHRRLRPYVVLDGAVAVAVGLAVFAPAPWLRRTMHPVH